MVSTLLRNTDTTREEKPRVVGDSLRRKGFEAEVSGAVRARRGLLDFKAVQMHVIG